jgi:predicted acetyltransferase
MPFEIRPITPDELQEFMLTEGSAFGHRPSEQDIVARRPTFEFDRSLAAFDGDRIVGTAGALSLELTLPGTGAIPAAGVSWVGVLPTHRRRGILTSLMRRQLADVRERGEPLAILTASESVIYGRFGYGLATSMMRLSIDKPFTAFARPWAIAGQVRQVDHAAALELLPPLYDRIRRTQPGMVSRSAAFWQLLLADPDKPLNGADARYYVVYQTPEGQVDGAAHYRARHDWGTGLSQHTLIVREALAATTEARAALWSYLFGIDLIATVELWGRPLDEPLRWMLADPRRLRVTNYTDDLWLRLLDIPAALAARRYTTAGRIVFAVADAFCPENSGRYLLEGGPDGASCRRTDDEPDLALGVATLGAAYLGGVRFATLARAGRVEERTAGALARADALFATDPLPYSGTPF